MAFAYSLYIGRITYIKVEAMTGKVPYAQSNDPHALVIVLKDGSKHEAELPNAKDSNALYEIELSAQSDFKPPLDCTKKKIKRNGVSIEARGNDGWQIAWIETYAMTAKKPMYTRLTADPTFQKWLDGNGADDYLKHVLTKARRKKSKKL